MAKRKATLGEILRRCPGAADRPESLSPVAAVLRRAAAQAISGDAASGEVKIGDEWYPLAGPITFTAAPAPKQRKPLDLSLTITGTIHYDDTDSHG